MGNDSCGSGMSLEVGLEMAIILLFMKDRTQKSRAYLIEWGKCRGRGTVGCRSQRQHASPPLITLDLILADGTQVPGLSCSAPTPANQKQPTGYNDSLKASLQVPHLWEQGMLGLMIEQAERATRSLRPMGAARDHLQQGEAFLGNNGT